MTAQYVRASMRTQRVIAAMRNGATLHRTNRRTSAIWQLSDGTQLTEDAARAIIARGDIVGGDDSLFAGLSQTWRYIMENDNV